MSGKRIRSILIDDDNSIIITLKHLLETRYSDLIELCGTASNVSSGVKLAREQEPALIFLDINLPDGEGFDVLSQIQDDDFNFDVIFITAHDQFALKAFDFAALDYIMKPFNPEDIDAALDRVRRLQQQDSIKDKVNVYQEAKNQEYERMIIPSSDGLSIINIDDILRLEASDTYTFFYINNGQKLLASKPLSNFERILADLHFQRIHSKNLVNLKYIQRYNKGKGGSVIMTDGAEVEVSVRKKTEFLNALKQYARSL